jgi:ABC-type uncharacterized transport system permease subunit
LTAAVLALAGMAVLFYLLSACYELASLFWLRKPNRGLLLLVSIVAAVWHAWFLLQWVHPIGSWSNFNVLNMFSVAAWLVSLLTLITIAYRAVDILAIVVFPFAGISIVLVVLFPSGSIIDPSFRPELVLHVTLSLLAYSLCCLAGLLALVLALQERLLRRKRLFALMQQIPPLQSLETLMFQVILMAMLLLTTVIVSAIYFYHTVLFTDRWVLQKTLLVIISWLIYLVLLVGRYWYGWRGNKAVYGTIFSALLLFVTYFISHLLLEQFH